MPRPDWEIERYILEHYDELAGVGKIQSWEEHFKRFVSIIWGRPECKRKFLWNPYAERMLDGARKHKFLGISGHASSGKTEFGGIWALANFFIKPLKTKVFVTSTSLEESRMRIWGVIEAYWNEAEEFFKAYGSNNMPGKLVSSKGKILGVDLQTRKVNSLTGVALIAGGKGQDKDASTKIGFKAERVILIGDELPLLTHKLYEAADSNLFANPDFQMIGIGNLTSIFDPFGVFAEPAAGWDSITEDMLGWETKRGYCIRFNGEHSPNVVAGKELYPGLLTLEKLDEYKRKLGERSPGYYRMIKSFPCPTGQVDYIYSEPELVKNMAAQKGTPWLERPTPLAFLDPAFSHGGDRAAAAFGLFGKVQHPVTRSTYYVLEKTETIDLMIKVEARHKTLDRNQQLAEMYKKECEARGVAVMNRGVDSTGGGDPFATVLALTMGQGVLSVSFAGAASEKAVSATDRRTGKERFKNRVSELWYIGKEFLVSNQIRGLDAVTMQELCARTYKEIGDKVKVESKDDMKERTNGRSPDFADAWVGLIEVARQRFGFTPAARAKAVPKASAAHSDPFVEYLSPKSRRRYEPEMVGSFVEKGSGWGDY